MPSIQDLQNLSVGLSASSASTTSGQPTIIVQNGAVVDNGVCLPCDEGAGCTVTPTQAVTLDMGSFRGGSPSKLRLNFDNGSAVARHLTFLSDLGRNDIEDYPSLATYITPNAFSDPLFTVNGIASAAVVAELNNKLQGGVLITQLTLRFDNTDRANDGLANLEIILGHMPVDSNNSVVRTTIYDPFCDFCTISNTGNFTTHRYTFNGPVSFRDFIDLLIPAGASGTIELCYSIIDLPNTQADLASHQWL